MSIAVVTDSTACLPEEIRKKYSIEVVPLPVTINGVVGLEGVDVTPSDMARALGERRIDISTSRPASARLSELYRRLLENGASGVVSVHLSSKLSGTVDAARAAAAEVSGQVRVVDAQDAGMGVGFCALEAAEAANTHQNVDDVARVAEQTVDRTKTFFYVDTLEFLRRGGRISAASALFGTAFSVKPILNVESGKVVMRDKVRTQTRALARLQDLVITSSYEGDVDIALHHLRSPEKAADLGELLKKHFGKRLRHMYMSEVGAVIAAHCGPGLLGAVVHRRL